MAEDPKADWFYHKITLECINFIQSNILNTWWNVTLMTRKRLISVSSEGFALNILLTMYAGEM